MRPNFSALDGARVAPSFEHARSAPARGDSRVDAAVLDLFQSLAECWRQAAQIPHRCASSRASRIRVL
jgi:hypothetical protein